MFQFCWLKIEGLFYYDLFTFCLQLARSKGAFLKTMYTEGCLLLYQMLELWMNKEQAYLKTRRPPPIPFVYTPED